jgi:hypothetical protein
MVEVAYWAVVFAGAVTLVVEAYRQFSTPVETHSHDRYPILKEMDLEALCTKGELVRGFLSYALLYLGAYAVILGSTEIFAVVASEGEALEEAGARDMMSVAWTEDGTAFDLGKPIFVSAAIVSALSLGVFAPVEKVLRGYAHWIAAIPRGVYRVIAGLKRVDYDAVARHGDGPLAGRMIKLRDAQIAQTGDPEMIDDIARTLHRIDVLQPAILGDTRDHVFSGLMPPTVEALIDRCGTEYADLRQRLGDEPMDIDALQALQFDASRLCNNMQALFALLYIRSARGIDPAQATNATARIFEHLQQDRDPIYHAFAGAVFFMAITVLLTVPAAYLLTAIVPPERLPRFYAFLSDETILAMVQNVMFFAVVGSIALLTRDASIEYGRWRPWKLWRLPFMRYVSHAIFPGVAAVLVMALIKVLEYAMTVEVTGSFDEFILENWRFCLMQFGFGFTVAFAIFVVADQHSRNGTAATVALALLAMVPYVIWAFFVQATYDKLATLSFIVATVREMVLLTTPGISFVVAFALLVMLSKEATA